jgi:predicted nucleotidyltransferase
MRLTDHERRTLLQAIQAADPAAEVWLHGSRVRDEARGGDIDLLVLSQRLGLSDKLNLLARMHAALGEQRIDLTIARDRQRPFVRLAQAQGVRL